MKTIATILTSTLFVATALITNPAHAADSKIYAGEMCNPNANDYYVQHYWGRLRNNSDNTINFECPVVRDVVGQGIASSKAWVINQNYNQSLSCTLGMLLPLSGGVNSGVLGFFSSRSTAVVSSAPQALSPFGVLGHLNEGYTTMYCSVPGKYNGQQSGIVAYRIDEM